jgi:uncharacterized protein with ATP-grasp and redox domains
MNILKSIIFTPEIDLDITNTQNIISVKGEIPKNNYPFTLAKIYPEIPVLDIFKAYFRIADEFTKLDSLLHEQLKLRSSFMLRRAINEQDAFRLFHALFDPIRQPSQKIYNDSNQDFFRIWIPRPFSLGHASSDKLIHTLGWIDSNMKLMIENVEKKCKIPFSVILSIAESAFTIYCLIIKMQDYRLARNINFNYSMFLQERIIELIFSDALYKSSRTNNRIDLLKIGKLSNSIALQLLKGVGDFSYRQLCTLSVFMGVVWTSMSDIQQSFIAHQDKTLSDLELCLKKAAEKTFCIDHIKNFIDYVGKNIGCTILVVLDDNGESVFDMALFQQLLRDTKIKVVFMVNRYPVSNNIALDTFLDLLNNNYFDDLRFFLNLGRVSLCIEEQFFRSFEYDYLSPQSLTTIKTADIAYIKGVNFFETLQPIEITRYYCFTVSGMTSSLLTGCKEGAGIFARVDSGKEGYIYSNPSNIITLKELSYFFE